MSGFIAKKILRFSFIFLIFKHQSFKNSNDYDIALVQLASPVEFSNTISPICLPGGRVEKNGASGIITGWVSFFYSNKHLAVFYNI